MIIIIQMLIYLYLKDLASNLSNFGNDTITDFQVGLDTARLFLNNSDIVSEDTSYSLEQNWCW